MLIKTAKKPKMPGFDKTLAALLGAAFCAARGLWK
jgi:hypothetical protein